MGIDRVAMLKYGIPDLRTFFEADLRWLRHYGFVPLDIPHHLWRAVAMKFTLPWLKEHLATDASLQAICDRLTMLGLEVEEGVADGADLGAFSVAYVREARQHPNADGLRLCTVETRHGVFEVFAAPPTRAPA